MAKAQAKTGRPKSKAPTKKTAKPNPAVVKKPRRLKQGTYKSFTLQKRIKHSVRLPNVWQLTRSSALLLWEYKRLFATIALIYGLLNLLLVRGLASGTNVSDLKEQFSQASNGNFSALGSSVSIFALLVSSSGNGSSETAGAYQLFLGLIVSLATIWTLRQVIAGTVPRARDAYYRGMYPLVPFILVLLVCGLQLLPLIIGSSLYSLVISNGIAILPAEKLVWALLFAVLALLSFYMLTSSLFALYISTLPDMTPLKALRSARQLVRYRRWTVLRKILWLPLLLLIVCAIIMLPIIVVLTPLAQWVFFILTMFSLLAVHAYMYTLYRELLNE